MSNFVRWVIGGDEKKPEEKPAEKPSEQQEKTEEKKEEVALTPEQLRLQRLQRLQSQQESQPKKIETPIIQEQVETPKKSEAKKIPKKKTSPTDSTPIKKIGSSPYQKSPSSSGAFKPDTMDLDDFSPKTPQHVDGSFLKPDEKSIHNIISSTLLVTLQKRKTGEQFYLESLSETVEEKFFTEDMMEIALVERLAAGFFNDEPLYYLVHCYKRLEDQYSKEKARKDSSFIRISLMDELRNLIVSYFGIILANDHFFPEKVAKGREGPLKFLNFLLAKMESAYELPNGFFDNLMKRLTTYEIESIFTPILLELRAKKKKMTMLDEYLPILHTMIKLTSYPEICQIIVNFPNFCSPDYNNGNLIENDSFLGPFFQISTYPFEAEVVGQHHFREVKTLSVKQLQDIKAILRSEIKSYQGCLHKIVYNFLSKKDIGKAPIIKWMAYVLEGNKGRAMMNINPNTSSSEGFMTNFCSVMLKLSAPIISNDKSLKNIDTSYTLTNNIVNFKEETKMSANGETVEKLAKQLDPSKSYNFATECFYFTYRAIQLGPLKTFGNYRTLLANCKETLNIYEAEKKIDPYSQQFLKAEDEYMLWVVRRWSCETQLFESEFLGDIIKFYQFASKWLMTVADPENKGLPLSKTVPVEFTTLNESFVENIIDFYNLLSKYNAKIFDGVNFVEPFNMMIYFMDTRHYVLNPYVRGKIPDLFATLTPFDDGNNFLRAEFLENCLLNNPTSQTHLIPAIMKLYVDIERTGASSQFYDKFTPRYYIALFMKYIWTYQIYRESFVKAAQSDRTLKFFNLMLNDAIYLLDESIEKLHLMNQYESDYGNPTVWSSYSPQVQQDKLQEYRGAGRTTTMYMQLANETVHMMKYLSKDAPEPFLRKEMVERVAYMLNYFLSELAGDKCQNLKVMNPEKYNFSPKNLITEITDTYINFDKYDNFIEAIAIDERSYSDKIFQRAKEIMKKIKKRDEFHVARFETLAKQAKEAKERLETMEEDLGEIPDEYLDPITYTLMEDPVILPSKVVMDRSSIEKHLLNDATDPFNRQPLKSDQLVPDDKLKAEIQNWKKKTLEAARKK